MIVLLLFATVLEHFFQNPMCPPFLGTVNCRYSAYSGTNPRNLAWLVPPRASELTIVVPKNGKARTKEIRLNLRDGRSAAAGAGVLQGAAGTAVTVAGNGNDGQNDHGCQQDNDYQCGGVHRTARAIK